MCEGCHNKQSWNINNGFDMSVDEVFEEIMKTRLQTSPIQEGAALHAGELIELSEKLSSIPKRTSGFTAAIRTNKS
ncbi:hypothetical protein PO124_21575 [Bacillus licheniformis]|nr:hypothetical protein [Bacillus licheniformis]